jgi:hypothetical protein
MYMGRKQKYFTDEEKLKANRDKYMRYYWKNVKKIRKEKLRKYYENKRYIQNNKQG